MDAWPIKSDMLHDHNQDADENYRTDAAKRMKGSRWFGGEDSQELAWGDDADVLEPRRKVTQVPCGYEISSSFEGTLNYLVVVRILGYA